jgi:hypothetical protein
MFRGLSLFRVVFVFFIVAMLIGWTVYEYRQPGKLVVGPLLMLLFVVWGALKFDLLKANNGSDL